ncbi:MAG: sulfite exporter TauE/SafE family protein [Candidatus Omnitrophota bacterium]|nr:MAG: sulfite exporter TauE/SafE family protein [Candidatus Omnitrophota bacterium]
MDAVGKTADSRNLIKTAAAFFVITICLYATFSVPSSGSAYHSLGLSEGRTPIIAIIIVGFVIGSYGTIVGIGGGPLIMPILILFYDWSTEVLVATSLFVVFLNAFSGTIGYARQKRIDYKGGMKFALAVIPGAMISGFFHHVFNIKFFDVIFGTFLIFLVAYSFLSINRVKPAQTSTGGPKRASFRHAILVDKFGQTFDFYSNDELGVLMNLLLGFFVGFLGIGGGVFQVPILLFLLYYPTHIATATSHYITMLASLCALIPHVFLGNVYFAKAIWMGLGVVCGAQVGARLAPRIKSKGIIYLFIIVLLIFAVELFFK